MKQNRTPASFRAVISSIESTLKKSGKKPDRALSYEIAAKIFGFGTSNALIAFAKEEGVLIQKLEPLETITLSDNSKILARYRVPGNEEDTWIEGSDKKEKLIISAEGTPFIATKIPLDEEKIIQKIKKTCEKISNNNKDRNFLEKILKTYKSISVLPDRMKEKIKIFLKNESESELQIFGSQRTDLQNLTIFASKNQNWNEDIKSTISKLFAHPKKEEYKQETLNLPSGSLKDPGPRPTQKEICIEAVKMASSEIFEYGEMENASEKEKQETLNNIVKSLRFYSYDEAEMAKDMSDRYGWNLRRDLVDLCETIQSKMYSAEKKLTKTWVTNGGIRPKYQIGDKICGSQADRNFTPETGNEIIGVLPEEARYIVRTDNMNLIINAESITGPDPSSRQKIHENLT